MNEIRTVYQKDKFAVQKVRDGYIVWNTEKEFKEGHTHISDFDTAKRLISLSIHKEVPRSLSRYLRVSLMRLSNDADYTARILAGKGNCMNFGEATARMREGYKITREAWPNGVFVFYMPNKKIFFSDLSQEYRNRLRGTRSIDKNGRIEIRGYFIIREEDGSLGIGWVAEIEDVLAEDWVIVHEKKERENDGETFLRNP